MVIMAAGCKQGQAQNFSLACQLYISCSRQGLIPVAATPFVIAQLDRLKGTVVQQHGASYAHALETMLAPAPMLCSVFSYSLWHALLQDVSYEPGCQVWSIENDALQHFLLSYS